MEIVIREDEHIAKGNSMDRDRKRDKERRKRGKAEREGSRERSSLTDEFGGYSNSQIAGEECIKV